MNDRPRHLLFLSHAGVDSEAARALAERIEQTPYARKNGLKVWFDKRDLRAGTGWQRQLEDVIEHQSTAFAVYLGATGVVNWVESEVRIALARARTQPAYPFIPILSAGSAGSEALPAFARQYQGVRDVEGDPEEFSKFIQAALRETITRRAQLVNQPFVGLQSFGEADTHLFFGRENETNELLERLRKNRLVIVLGDSGSGKSSLVKAGLITRYRGGALAEFGGHEPDGSIWHVIETRPRGNPFTSLADDLSLAASQIGITAADRGTYREWVRSRQQEKIRDALIDASPPHAHLLLFVDQFEELFTLTEESAQDSYINTLLVLADDSRVLIHVVLTMRRDYYNLCSRFPKLYHRLEITEDPGPKYALRRMSAESLRACIQEPLKLAGEEPSEAFIQKVIEDVGDQPGELAVLEVALKETWGRRHQFKGYLLEAYLSIHGVAGALATLAEEMFTQKLNNDERLLTEAAFVRLVRLGETAGTTRRVAMRDEFSAEAWVLLQKLAREDYGRLVTIGGPVGGETVELSHEAVVSQWPRYQTWLQAGVENKRRLDHLIPLAKRWSGSGSKDEAFLLTGYDLQESARLLDSVSTWLSVAEKAFLRRSLAEQLKRERRASWLFRAVAVLALLAAALSIGFGNAFLRARRTSGELEDNRGQLERQLATERGLRASFLSTQDGAGRSSLLVALRGIEGLAPNSSPPTELLRGLSDALVASHVSRPVVGLTPFGFIGDGHDLIGTAGDSLARWNYNTGEVFYLSKLPAKIVSGGLDGSGNNLFAVTETGQLNRWSLASKTWGPSQSIPVGYKVASWSRDKSFLVLRRDYSDYSFPLTETHIWNVALGQLVPPLKPYASCDVTYPLDFSSTAKVVLAEVSCGSFVPSVDPFDVKTGASLAHLRSWEAEFSPDGTLLASVATIGTNDPIELWNTSSWKVIRSLHHGAGPRHLRFSFDGKSLAATGGAENFSIALWDVETGRQKYILEGHAARVSAVAFDKQSSQLASVDVDGTALLWDLAKGTLKQRYRGYYRSIQSCKFDATGHYVLLEGKDGYSVWNLRPGNFAKELPYNNFVRVADFSRDGSYIVSGSWDGAAKVWYFTSNEQRTLAHPRGVQWVDISPDNKRIATAADDGFVRVWDVATTKSIFERKLHDAALFVKFDNKGDRIISVGKEGFGKIVDMSTGAEIVLAHRSSNFKGPVRGDGVTASFSPNGRFAIIADVHDDTGLWDSTTGKMIARLDGRTTAAFGAAGRLLAAGDAYDLESEQRVINIWELPSMRRVAALRGYGGYLLDMHFNRDGTRLAVASNDHMAYVFDSLTGAQFLRLTGHEQRVRSVRFNHDGSRIVTASNDKTARIWDAKSGEELIRLKGHVDIVNAARFSPDGRWVITAGRDGRVLLFPADVDGLRALACAEWRKSLQVSRAGEKQEVCNDR